MGKARMSPLTGLLIFAAALSALAFTGALWKWPVALFAGFQIGRIWQQARAALGGNTDAA